MRTPSTKLRDRWLTALLPEAATSGWTAAAMRRSAEQAELTEGEQALAAPNGVTDLIDHYFDQSADQMLDSIASETLSTLRMHERVAACLMAWLEVMSPHKQAVGKAAGRGLAPWGAGAAVKRVWSIADTIWEAAGDTATDYNRQTKRALLSAVIPSIVLHWLDHEDPVALETFIQRRLQQAMKVGRAGSKIVGPVLDLVEQVRARRNPRDL